jgi:hypothetical protein
MRAAGRRGSRSGVPADAPDEATKRKKQADEARFLVGAILIEAPCRETRKDFSQNRYDRD